MGNFIVWGLKTARLLTRGFRFGTASPIRYDVLQIDHRRNNLQYNYNRNALQVDYLRQILGLPEA